MAGKWVTLQTARHGRYRAYTALPQAGKGPALLLLPDTAGIDDALRARADRYAEEGYVVLVPDLYWRVRDATQAAAAPQRLDVDIAVKDIGRALRAARALKPVTGKVGVLGFDQGSLLAWLAAARLRVDAAVLYGAAGIDRHRGEAARIRCPVALHIPGADPAVPPAAQTRLRKAVAGLPLGEAYVYPLAGAGFADPHGPAFDRSAASLAWSRSLGLLRRAIGPRYDLETLWDRHTFLEFGARDVAATMKTMVAAPYVNHIPVLTGGVGHDDLARFYKYHFIPKCPADTRLVPFSRTVGADRIVDEMLFCFTHDVEIDWMLPGIAPTGRYVEVPLVAIVNFRGPKLYHEHIYWDQASVLVQIGRLDETALPVAGHAQARKLLDESLPSNTLMRRWSESAGKAAP